MQCHDGSPRVCLKSSEVRRNVVTSEIRLIGSSFRLQGGGGHSWTFSAHPTGRACVYTREISWIALRLAAWNIGKVSELSRASASSFECVLRSVEVS